MPAPRFQRIFLVAGILSLFTAYVGLWLRFINDPVERTGSDFIAFYTAGRAAQKHGFSNVYQAELQQDVQEAEVGFALVPGQVLLYNHVPFLLPILRVLVSDDYVSSFYRWVIPLMTIYCISLIILGKLLERAGTDEQTIWLLGISSFLFLPLFFSLINGQDTAVLFLGTALWLYGLASGKEWLAGLGLSLTTVRPQISLTLAIPMLFSHRKVFLGYALGSGALAALSFFLTGADGTRDFIDILLISAGGEWHGMKENAMFNLIGILTRISGSADVAIRKVSWLIYGATIAGLAFLWARKKSSIKNLVGLSVILALFTSPHLHFHDLTLLLIPFCELVHLGYLRKFGAIAAPIAASLLLLVSNATPVLQYTTPYLLMVVLAYAPYYSKERQHT